MAAVAALLGGLLGGCGISATPPAAPSPSDDVGPLRQQVASQAARITSLETQVALVQAKQATGGSAVATTTPQPTATIVPAVAGLVTDGTTKGVASAKVTITEYIDYL